MVLCVEDIMILGSNCDEVHRVAEKISESFSFRVEAKMNKFLGLMCAIRDDEIIIQRFPTIRRILKQFRMENFRSASTLFTNGKILDNKMSPQNLEERRRMAKFPWSLGSGE